MEDAEAIFSTYAQDPEATKYLLWRPYKSVETVYHFILQCLAAWKERTSFQWVVVLKDDKELIGMVGSRVDGHKVELGYVLARAYWNRGYGTEAVQALVDWAFSQEEIYRVWAVCDVENRASARVLEKVGMVREGVLRRWSVHPNRAKEPRDCYCYARSK
jgi:RimJ/RimL family protein N-acetyltransferase